ncbi:MAG: type III pantothenate kinase [Brachymonas sp.]|nr:type III pantothenate kinase [Brachymonas sp.]
MTFLAIDIGNTRLKWSLYEQPRPGSTLLAHGAEFLEQVDTMAERAWKLLPTPTLMLGCVVASGSIKYRVEEQMEELWPDLQPQWVVSRTETAGLVNGYDIPSRLGVDRWVAMVGARQHMLQATTGTAPRPMVVVMVGTAVTVEAIDAQGKFLGGLILPGHGMMLRALEMGAAGLNHMPTGQVVPFPTNTSDALTSGGTFALVGAVQRMVRHLHEHCGEPPMCVMTGGAGWKVAPYMETPFELVESLIFDGLLALAAESPHPEPPTIPA